MPRTRALSLLVVAGLSITLAACSSSDSKPADPADAAASAALFDVPAAMSASLDMTDIKYSAGALTAKSGEVLEVALANKGSIDHDVTVKELPGDRALRVEGKAAKVEDGKGIHAHIKSGSSGTLRLKVPAPGTYEFYCSVAGHKEAGMKGTLTVQ